MLRFTFVYYSLSILLLASSNIALANKLPDSVSSLLEKYNIAQTDISIDVRNMQTQRPILQFNVNKAMNPASVMKVVTTMAALDILGPTFVWGTEYLYTGNIKDGTLHGDLILRGGGDPFLTEDRLWQHIRSIQNRGVKHITGKLIIDNSKFSLPKHDRTAFDGQGNRLYNVGPDAALVNFSATRIHILPTGDKPIVFTQPQLDNLIIDNQLVLEEGACTNQENGWHLTTTRKEHNVVASVEGKYRRSCGEYAIGRALVDNIDYTYHLFKALWHSTGGLGISDLSVSQTPKDAKRLDLNISLPLSDIITSINKYSNNVMSQQLLLTIGGETFGYPTNFADSSRAVKNWITQLRLDIPNFVIENGAGLSRIARISSGGLGNLLSYAWGHSYQPEFLSSLPISAVDGTMRKRLKKHPLAGQARIKTGYLRDTRSMGGYVRGKEGQTYSVVMLINSSNINYASGNVLQDALLKWVYDL